MALVMRNRGLNSASALTRVLMSVFRLFFLLIFPLALGITVTFGGEPGFYSQFCSFVG